MGGVAPPMLPVLSMLICAVAMGPIASAAELPPGKGRDTFEKTCTTCHDADVVMQQGNTRSGWTDIVKAMKDLGADATPVQFNEIVDYLTEHFGATGKISPAGTKGKRDASAGAAETGESLARRALPWNQSTLRIGQAIYRENCVVCHDVDFADSKKSGPSFHHLFQREKMPNGNTKPSRSYVAAKIRAGGKLMPAFRQTFTADEISALLDYMQSK